MPDATSLGKVTLCVATLTSGVRWASIPGSISEAVKDPRVMQLG